MLRRRMMMGQGGGETDYSLQYLTFTAVGGQSNFRYRDNSGSNTLYYSIDDGETWTALAAGTNSPYIADGESILWKANGISLGRTYGIKFEAANSYGYTVSGNILSLLYGDNFVGQNTMTADGQFESLFENNTVLRDASNLILPINLRSDCFSAMFYGCTTLAAAPTLRTPILAQRCYEQMFYGCTLLNYIKCLAVDTSASACISDWVSGVAASGTFVKASNATWSAGTSGRPSGWTVTEDAYEIYGYTVLAGLTMNGNQYFDTGIYLEGSDTLRLSYTPTAACNVIGCYTTTSATNNYSLYLSATSGAKYMRYGSGTYNSYFVANTRYDVELTPTGSSGLEVDSTWSALTFTTSTTCLIGMTSTTATSAKFTGTMHGAVEIVGKAYCVPVLRNTDAARGYYDTRNSAFLSNQGSGTATPIYKG